jgi:hypothetical protein
MVEQTAHVPGIEIEKEVTLDELQQSLLDRLTLKNTIFALYKETEQDDLTIIPLHTRFSIFTAFKPGVSSKYGLQQDMAIEFDDLDVQMGECQYLKDPNSQTNEVEQDDDDDDFDEDEDDEEPASKSKSSGKLRISNMARLVCSMKSVVNEKIKENKASLIENSELNRITRGHEDKKYVWRPFNSIGLNF